MNDGHKDVEDRYVLEESLKHSELIVGVRVDNVVKLLITAYRVRVELGDDEMRVVAVSEWNPFSAVTVLRGQVVFDSTAALR